MYRIINNNYRSHPMTLHECLLHLNVFMEGLMHWKTHSAKAKAAVDAGYSIVRA